MQRKNSKFRRIVFGMGDYAFDGLYGFDRYCNCDYDHAPVYMRRLICLCDLAAPFWIENIE